MKKSFARVIALIVWHALGVATAGAQTASAKGEPAATEPELAISTGFTAKVRFDVSHSPQGPFAQVVPRIGYDFRRWSVDIGAPLEFVGAYSKIQGSTSHRGIGDAFLTLSYAIESERANFLSTGLVAAPTGDSTIGLGAGEVTWDWTNHVDRSFGRLEPFVDAGFGSGLGSSSTTATVAGAGGASQSRSLPYIAVGKQARLGAGLDLSLWGPLSWNVSAYDTLPWGNQKIISLFIPVKASGQLAPRVQRAFEEAAVTEGEASLTADHGFSTSLDVSPRSYFYLSVAFSRSVQMNLNVFSVSVGVNLTKLYREARQRP